jgi:3-deoxy-7-phosphoheptulonate synthase/chorismate mutase
MTEHDLKSQLSELRVQASANNLHLMEHLNEFIHLSNQIGEVKDKLGLVHFDPVREGQMLKEILEANPGPMPQDQMKRIFKEVFKASVEEMGLETKAKLKVNRLPSSKDKVIQVGDVAIGGDKPVMIAGPCAVESLEQMLATAQGLKDLGVHMLRGGAFKPRTSPYSFQGLEEEGLKIMRDVADRLGMSIITEVLSVRDVDLVAHYADVLQVGTRNMFNYALLKELGRHSKPVMLKRGMMATMEEFVLAAEYIYVRGNHKVILCERGIRTFETWTRNTLDISAVPILKQETFLPVIVDISHALGRKDIIKPIAHAALAAGADGLMFEAHYNPSVALSDSEQQLNLEEVSELLAYLRRFSPTA